MSLDKIVLLTIAKQLYLADGAKTASASDLSETEDIEDSGAGDHIPHDKDQSEVGNSEALEDDDKENTVSVFYISLK